MRPAFSLGKALLCKPHSSLPKPRGVVLNLRWEYRHRRWRHRLKSCATFALGLLQRELPQMYLMRHAMSWRILYMDGSRIVPDGRFTIRGRRIRPLST